MNRVTILFLSVITACQVLREHPVLYEYKLDDD